MRCRHVYSSTWIKRALGCALPHSNISLMDVKVVSQDGSELLQMVECHVALEAQAVSNVHVRVDMQQLTLQSALSSQPAHLSVQDIEFDMVRHRLVAQNLLYCDVKSRALSLSAEQHMKGIVGCRCCSGLRGPHLVSDVA